MDSNSGEDGQRIETDVARTETGYTIMDSNSDEDGQRIETDVARTKVEIEYDHFTTTDGKVQVRELPGVVHRSERAKHIDIARARGNNVGRSDLLKMLRQKLLEHKWGDAMMIMESVSSLPLRINAQMNDVFWKVGNEILYNHPATKYEDDLVNQHRQASRTQCYQSDGGHVLYEYVLYLLVNKDFKRAREVLNFYYITLKTYNSNHRCSTVLANWLRDWSPMFEGYLGVLDYLSWKEVSSALETRFPLPEDEAVATRVAEEGVKHFETALKSPGVWDIFILKYVELLVFCGEGVEAEEVLRTNSLKYPENPNAHKYWYEFLLKHPELEENRESQIAALSKLHDVAPSDIYMLDLHGLRMETAFKCDVKSPQFFSMASMALKIIFDMLDYDTWSKHEKSWRTLARSLKKVKCACNASDFSEMLETIWRSPMRHTWWPRYHFKKDKARDDVGSSRKLVKYKSKVAKILLHCK